MYFVVSGDFLFFGNSDQLPISTVLLPCALSSSFLLYHLVLEHPGN